MDTSGERWTVSGPRVLELGGDDEPVREVKVQLVGGRADVVAHDDQVRVRVEVDGVHGHDVTVTWTDGVLEVGHPALRWDDLLEGLRHVRGGDRAEVSIAVPRAVAVRLGTVTADGLVSGTTEHAQVRTVSGTIVVDGVHAHVDARTVSGSIEVVDQHGSLTADSVSGSVTVQAVSLPELRGKSVSGSLAVDVATAPSTIGATTVSGDVTVRIPAGSGFDLTAKSVSGRVVAGGELLDGKPGKSGGRISSGDGAVQLVARTVSGDVTLLQQP